MSRKGAVTGVALLVALFAYSQTPKKPAPAKKKPKTQQATPGKKRATGNGHLTTEWQRRKAKYDSILSVASEQLTWYVKLKGLEKPFQTREPSTFEQEVEAAYAIGRDKQGRLEFALEENYGPWGEYTNREAHHFDAQGRLRLFEYSSGFFHSRCVHNDILSESRQLYYDASGKMVKQIFTLLNPEGKAMDSLRCEFPYRKAYKVVRDTVTWKAERRL